MVDENFHAIRFYYRSRLFPATRWPNFEQQIERMSETRNNTFINPKTGKSPGFPWILISIWIRGEFGSNYPRIQILMRISVETPLLTNRFEVFGTQAICEFALFPSSKTKTTLACQETGHDQFVPTSSKSVDFKPTLKLISGTNFQF